MPKKEDFRVLVQGAPAWNKWRRDENILVPFLSRAKLRGADLTGVNFHRALLLEADLTGALLIEADLDYANLSSATLVKCDFSRAKLNKAKLNHATLDRAMFVGAELVKAELDHSTLIDAYFNDAKLVGASLVGANLSKANLGHADLRRADLSGATLSGAKLDRANLSGAILNQTDFSQTIMAGTIFNGTDLSNTIGLESALHRGPSTLSIDTVYLSKGAIPDVFLRGLGVPEALITYIPSLTEEVLQFYSCFISYSHADASFARRLHDALQGKGIRCWLDEHQLLPGDKIFAEVDRGIRLWDKVLLCCSKASLTSWWVDNEIEIAFDKEQQLWNSRGKEVLVLIPLNLDGFMLSGEWRDSKATQIKSRLAADFTGWERANDKFEVQFSRLVRALQTEGGREPPPKARL